VNVLILHDAVTESSRPDEIDALHQAELVAGALKALGHETSVRGVGLDLEDLSNRWLNPSTDLVFNLVESLAGHGRLLHIVPALLEARGIAFTGSGSSACLLTTSKPLAKAWLHRNDIPTPAWREIHARPLLDLVFPCACIVKPVWEDASVGIEDGAIVRVERSDDVVKAMEVASHRFGEVFAEQFVDGREFNLSILADGGDNVEVLPEAEIEFVDYPPGKPRIVGYEAKWDENSFEYEATRRRFDFGVSDRSLLTRMRELALRCWHLFGLRGYARVDFRVDDSERPWVLEVNANPCLSADAGFMAAAGRRGLTVEQVIERIIAAGVDRPIRKGTLAHA